MQHLGASGCIWTLEKATESIWELLEASESYRMHLRTSRSIYERLKCDMLISEVIDSLAGELKRTDGRTDGIVWHPSFMNGPRTTAIELRI